ncbi:transcription factor BHLH148-like isoform X2 [Lolium rigidum]|uniref:transcription factor BHLH148-like isoform X2 n=1 Tax=Lolium rigidum TaxID=89674 RepID=UPI001F5DE2C7|nr:transcription factor BHLH148-like isoform X2 [Lolium rigidum]
MQMDSYYSFQDDSHFFAGAGGIPGSPDLRLADLIASLSEPLPAPVSQSAFQDYRAAAGARGGGRNGNVNIHRRMMSVLGRMAPGSGEDEEELPQQQEQKQQHVGAVESSRGFRHMMRERQRREKLSQSYADLYAMVSSRSKDKNSIVQSAASYIHELKVARDQLRRRSEDLKAKILGHDAQQPCVKVQFEVDEPSSSIDSMIGALRSLKGMNVKTRGIRSTLAGDRLTTEINVETTIAASEVERAVEEALQEVERKQLPADSDNTFPGSRSSNWPQSHVQNVF